MIDDTTTFFLAFTTVWLGIAAYLVALDRKVTRLAASIQDDTKAKKERSDEPPQ